MISGTERQLWRQQSTELSKADLKNFGTTVVIAPHPDDESLGCGGTIALLRELDLPVYVIFVSDGSMSHPNSKKYPAEKLRQLRENEALQALKILNISESNAVFMRLKDRSVPDRNAPDFDSAVQQLLVELNQIQPDTILITWEKDHHPDHRASYQIMEEAVFKLGYRPRILQYLIWIWELGNPSDIADNQIFKWFYVDVETVSGIKKNAIHSHLSQVSRLIDDDPQGFMLSPEILAHFDYNDELFIEKL